eukprot:CAMPEP_0174721788 /NCGR_PEP_ID=MMETSP1094-20130205/37182_1 /TAXON_ID=156173 /ORGANISM="Chrysochromulina brevifilum, Strain UTEX LB 985" /LENGTH=90 /DNA_ID=CAMNT_0015922539 /DNA_START=557 /DNA_END=826 /DNA_ORIENTATION=-
MPDRLLREDFSVQAERIECESLLPKGIDKLRPGWWLYVYGILKQVSTHKPHVVLAVGARALSLAHVLLALRTADQVLARSELKRKEGIPV